MCLFRQCAQGRCQRHSGLQCYRCVWSVLIQCAFRTSRALAQAENQAKVSYHGRRMRHVVLDEADLLLTGGYEKDTQRILKSFLEGDRQQRASAAASKFGLTDDMLQRMPRQLRKAAQTGKPCWHMCE